MAKNLGINIKIDYSDINKLETKLNQLAKDKIDIKLNINSKSAINQLEAFETKYKTVKSYVEKGMKLNLDTKSANIDGIFDNIKKNAKIASSSFNDVANESKQMMKSIEGSDSTFSKITKSMKTLADGTGQTKVNIDKVINSLQKESETYTNGARSATKVTEDRVSALKEIASKVKEIGNLERSQIGSDDKTNAAIQKRIDLLKQEAQELKNTFKNIAGSNSDDSSIVSQVQALSDYKTELKKISQEKSEQAQYDKETQSLLNQVISLENERFSILKSAQNAGRDEAAILTKKADLIKDQSNALVKQEDLFSRVNVEQVQGLNTLTQQNNEMLDYIQKINSAKEADKARASAQKAAFNELKSDYKQIYSLQQKITKLTAEENAGVISGKDSQKLDALRRELAYREENYNLLKTQASAQGNLTSQQEAYLNSIKQEATYKLKSVQQTAEINADTRVTAQLYDELTASIKNAHSIKMKMENVGDNEASVLREIIALEEKRQSVIQETLSIEKRSNSVRDNEIADLRSQTAELEAQNTARRQANSLDKANSSSSSKRSNYSNSVGILGDLLNPRAMASDVQQAAMTIYNSMAPIDEQLVNIAKVADAPAATLEKFAETIYDTASKVGKSAEEYGVSVERWVTAGKTLSESTQLATYSVMGSFVGNIDEADMVDYMSIPLNAYKKDALEATDVINAMNEVANQNAIEMDDLGKAYQKAASTSAQAGTSFSELTGIITAAQESTRAGGESVGNSIKAMDVNFGKISSQLTKGDQEKFNFFKNIGVDIVDANGNLNSTFDILEQLEGVWDNLSDTDKSTAGFYAAGKHFQNIFTGVMTNWDSVTKSMNEAQNQVSLLDKESGSAFQEFAKQQDSIQFKAAQLKNSWAEFLATIAGGKSGITDVMDTLNKGLQKATELAKNPAIMNLATQIVKLIAVMTGITVARKFFATITEGSIGALTSFKSLFNFISRNKAKAALNDASAAMTGLGTASKVTSKVATSGLGSIFAVGGKIIPVIGGIITALQILDAMGVPVWETMGKLISEVEKSSDKAKNKLKEYTEEQEKATKIIDNSLILNGTMENNNKLIKSYQDLVKEKEKAFSETKDPSSLTFSDEEFEAIKTNFNQMAESMGFDIRITMNNYSDIQEKYKQLIEYKKALSSEDANTLIKKGVNEKSSYSSANKSLWNEYSDDYGTYIQEKARMEATLSKNLTKEVRAAFEKEYKELLSENSYQGNFFNSDEMVAAEKANTKRIEELYKAREKLAQSARAGTLAEGFSGLDEKDQKTSIALISSELPLLAKKSSTYDEIAKKIQNNQDLSVEEQKQLTILNKDYASLNEKTSSWTKQYGEDFKNNVISSLQTASAETKKSQTDTENALRQLGESAGIAVEPMIEASKKGGRAFLDMMSDYGDMGASILGITNRIMAQAEINGVTWQEMAQGIQDDIDQLPEEKTTKYNLVQENGVANWDEIDAVLSLPDEIVTKYRLIDDDGGINIDNIVTMLDEVPEELKTKYKLDIDGDGAVELSEIQQRWSELSKEEKLDFVMNFTANSEDVYNKVEEVKKKQHEVEKGVNIKLTAEDLASGTIDDVNRYAGKLKDGDYTAFLMANPNNANTNISDIIGKLGSYNQMEASARLNADNQNAIAKYAETHGVVVQFDSETGEASFTAESSGFDGVANHVEDRLKPKTGTMSFVANLIGDGWSRLTNWLSGKSGSVSISANASKNGSVAVGSSFSASVGSQLSGTSKNTAINNATSKSTSTSSSNNTKVDSDVWRYWAKELYKGIPLENSMDNLKTAIDNAGDNQEKLISLYKKQISLLNQEIAYNKDLKNAQQSEMNSILSQLRSKGFKTSGNQITNLSRAKSFSGDAASDVNSLLSDWKSLYESIDGLNDTIKDLQQEQVSIKKSIEDAKEAIKEANIAKEAESIEKSVKKSESLLTMIENATSIQSTKESLVKDTDYEFSLSIKEQGMNTASSSMSKLIDEYNRLALATVNYAENAEDIQSQMSDVKSQILENADAILEYQESINSIRIDRLTEDYSKFSDVISSNLDSISNSIDNLKDGLISGTRLSDLASSTFASLDLTRKSKYEQEQEARIKLEAELDSALDAYAKKNVDRTEKVANAVLQIEKEKYQSLLGMASNYSNGKGISVSTVTSSSVDFGLLSATSSDKGYSEWKKRLVKVNSEYAKAYELLISNYDKASQGLSGDSLSNLQNKSIIDQLKLQEEMQYKLIELNNEMINQAKEELENTSLTTEQQQTLQDTIEEYRQSNIDAQNAIKESINSRYELEFDLMDKQADKAQKYSDNLSYLLDVADLINISSSGKQSIYDAIYQSKINQYATAKETLAELQKQQSEFTDGSYEWNLLQEKIDDVNSSLQDLTLDTLNSNKDSLGNYLDSVQETLEKGVLGGKTLDEWKDYQDNWVDGISKELELESLRTKLLDLEDDTLNKRLEMLDRQEAVSQVDLDYLDKQAEVLSLQKKLSDIEKERTVQTLVRGDDGTWAWQYVADQTSYNETKEDLQTAQKELDEYKKTQRQEYASALSDIIGKAKDGTYTSSSELQQAVNNINAIYGNVIGDTSGIDTSSISSIISAYDKYVSDNGLIVDSAIGGSSISTDTLSAIGQQFETSFTNISSQLGEIIGTELKNALSEMSTTSSFGAYNVQIGSLEFPNVTDTTGLEDFFINLPNLVDQYVYKK